MTYGRQSQLEDRKRLEPAQKQYVIFSILKQDIFASYFQNILTIYPQIKKKIHENYFLLAEYYGYHKKYDIVPLKSVFKYIQRLYQMNGSYYYSQEIGCNCFDLQPQNISYKLYTANETKPMRHTHKMKMSKQSLLNSSFVQRISTKTSLKRKKYNTTVDQIKATLTKQIGIQTKTLQNQSSNITYEEKKNKENRITSYKQNSFNLESNPNNPNKQNQNIHPIFAKNINTLQQILRTDKSLYISEFSQSCQKQSEINASYRTNRVKTTETSEEDIQTRTVKKRASINPNNIPWKMQPTLTVKFLQNQGNIQHKKVSNWKRVSIRPAGNGCQEKKLNKMCPKQIESYESGNTSGYQSQVLERGKFKWAPINLKTFGDLAIITTLHSREQSGFSKIVKIPGSRFQLNQ